MPTRTHGDAASGAPGATQAPQVHALFHEEVVAREAVGLLEHHGFRPESIAVVAASGHEWELLAPPRRRRRDRRSPTVRVVSPTSGVVVVVRTLRVDDARLVLGRADGAPVQPVPARADEEPALDGQG